MDEKNGHSQLTSEQLEAEPQAVVASEPVDNLPEAVNDPALTLAKRKLAGSDQCLNCGTTLQGPYCYYCGQPDRNFMRFFPALLRDLLEDLLDLDSRFIRTMKPLLFKPGRLTRDFLDGRRFRYTPPMRLYVFASIAFFLLAALISSNAVDINTRDKISADGGLIQITADSEADLQRVEEALKNVPADIREQIDLQQAFPESGEGEATDNVDGAQDEPDKTWFESGDISFNGEPWDRETNPFDIRWLPAWFNNWVNDEIEESPEKAEEINKNPNLIVDKVFDILPLTMFVLLPVVALLFKFWYLFSKRFYVEHLIFSLHNHSFLFVSLLLMLLLGLLQEFLFVRDMFGAQKVFEWITIALAVWVPIYLFVSLRTVYQQNWFLTIGKFAVIGISYLTLLGLVTSVVALLSFMLL